MARQPHERIFGIETEFGCLVADEDLGTPPEAAVEAIKDYLFYDLKIGAPRPPLARRGVRARRIWRPSPLNGARLYIDAVGSHLEYATAECRSLKDVVANDRAGQRWIVRAIKELDLEDQVSVYKQLRGPLRGPHLRVPRELSHPRRGRRPQLGPAALLPVPRQPDRSSPASGAWAGTSSQARRR